MTTLEIIELRLLLFPVYLDYVIEKRAWLHQCLLSFKQYKEKRILYPWHYEQSEANCMTYDQWLRTVNAEELVL